VSPTVRRSGALSGALVAAALLVPAVVRSQQSDLSISPFVSFLPSAGASPLAGLALTLAGDAGFSLRGSAHMSLENTNNDYLINGTSLRPWGADADAVFSLGARSLVAGRRTWAPYAFVGVGTANDGSGAGAYRSNWSYGAGLSVPLGAAIDAFGESRWRMSQFVLPTASLAPSPTNEFRFGLSFHVGRSPASPPERRRTRDRRTELTPSSAINTSRYPMVNDGAARVVETAQEYVGTPYRYGGTSPGGGFDAAGFVQYVFARHGVQLPRTSQQQARAGAELSPDWRAVSTGDLVMFEENGKIDHVAIYAGHNRIIHSSASGGGVRFDDLSTPRGEWFMDHMVAARRVTPDAGNLMIDLTRGLTAAAPLDPPDHAPKPAP
jgi:cell wall-associated NlpC family hydrolase